MTRAVCTRCGAMKHGAWTPCPECKYDPAGQGLEEEARALYLTDHYRSVDELEAAGQAIRRGEEPLIDATFVSEAVAEARARGAQTLIPKLRLGLGCAVAMVMAAAALAGVAILISRCT